MSGTLGFASLVCIAEGGGQPGPHLPPDSGHIAIGTSEQRPSDRAQQRGRAQAAEGFGVGEDAAEEVEALGLVEFFQRDGVDFFAGSGEVGVDLDAGDVGDDEEGRVVEGFAVEAELAAARAGWEACTTIPFSKVNSAPVASCWAGGLVEEAAEVEEVFV